MMQWKELKNCRARRCWSVAKLSPSGIRVVQNIWDKDVSGPAMWRRRSPNERERKKKKTLKESKKREIIIENRFSQRWFLIHFAAKRAPVYLKNTFRACIGVQLSGTGLSDISLRFRLQLAISEGAGISSTRVFSPVNHNGTTNFKVQQKSFERKLKKYFFFLFSLSSTIDKKKVTCLVYSFCYFAGNGRLTSSQRINLTTKLSILHKLPLFLWLSIYMLFCLENCFFKKNNNGLRFDSR